ncbi:hypothetical protein T07_14081 [Trichinella nelsoni]|uniref:Uncharacterized protein n=1 Tax=Trichinella nelsoni TaxID=6336 RepID=A0A0V0S014_9BILA|nr:hypothetical protein T07_14081 [Trichinella nelsoni]
MITPFLIVDSTDFTSSGCDSYRYLRSRARAIIDEESRERPTGVDSGNSGRAAVRAGNGKLQQFIEQVLEFPTVWAQFEANIHNSSDLDVATKPWRLSRPVSKAPPQDDDAWHLVTSDEAPVLSHGSRQGPVHRPPPRAAWYMKIGPEAEEDEDNLQKFLEFAQWQTSLLAKPMEEDMGTPARRTEHRTFPKKPLRSKWKSGCRVTSSAVALAVTATGSFPLCEGEHKAAACHPSGVQLPRASTVSSGWVQANSSQALALKHAERVGSFDGTQHRAMRHAGRGKSQNDSRPDCACVRTRWNPCGSELPSRHQRASVLYMEGHHRSFGLTWSYKERLEATGVKAPRRSADHSLDLWKDPQGEGCSQNGKAEDAVQVDHYYDFVTGPMRRNATGPVALETLLSWVVCGKPRSGPVAEKRVLLTKVEEPTNASLRRFWEVEAMGINPEDDAEPENARMVEKIEHAMRRLTAVERRLARSDKDIRDNNQPCGSIWRTGEEKERRYRVVFDGSRYGLSSAFAASELGCRRTQRKCTSRSKSTKKTGTPADFSGEMRVKGFASMSTTRVHARRHRVSAPLAAAEVLHNMYMFDLATSCESLDEAITLAAQLEEMMVSGSFHLHKWASNEPAALRKDHLTFISLRMTRRDGRDTKRELLRTVSSVFNPIGCLAPFTTTWIDCGPRGSKNLEELPLIKVPRALVPVPLTQVERVKLHALCDASELANGAVVYLRVGISAPRALMNLVTAKLASPP